MTVVVFDIGNVLIGWQPEAFYDRVIGEPRRRAFFDAVDLHGMNDRVDRGEPFGEVIRATADAHPDWRAEIMTWHDRWIDIAAPAIDHSVRLLRALRRKGVPVWSLTNFGRETFEIGRREYPFLEEFDRHFVSGHIGTTKPDPTIYAHVEEAGGATPGDLLFTDDRTDNIAAADARGWRTHLFEGPAGWAARLVSEGLLTSEEAR